MNVPSLNRPSRTDPGRSAPRLRRSPALVVAGVVLVVAGALTSVGIYSNLSQTQEVIAIVTAVARGEQISRTDLTTVQVGFDPMLKPIPASQLASIVGKYAACDLVPGTFLTAAAVGDRLNPAVGSAEVGIALTAGEYPDDGLLPGDDVLLIAVPDASNPGPPTSFNGTLVTATTTGGTLIASVMVSTAEAPQIAALSASNRLALVLATRER